MAELTLTLSISSPRVLRGQSAPFTLTLKNVGGAPETVDMMSFRNNNVILRAVDKSGKEYAGSAQRLNKIATGHDPHNREPATITLKPGDTHVSDGDFLAYMGELPVGTYSVTASYTASPFAQADSAPVEFKIEDMRPLWLGKGPEGFRSAWAPRRLAWLHAPAETGDAILYLLSLDAANPLQAESNRPLAPIPRDARPLLSGFSPEVPVRTHAIYRWGEGPVRIISLGDRGEPTLTEAPLANPSLRPMGPPLCTGASSFVFVAASASGSSAALVTVSGGKPSLVEFEPRPAFNAAACVHWSPDEKVQILWHDPATSTVWYLEAPLLTEKVPAPRKLLSAPGPVKHLRLDRRTIDGSTRIVATVLCASLVSDEWHRLSINTADGSELNRTSWTFKGASRYGVIDSSMHDNGDTAYLFCDLIGQIHYCPPDASRLSPQTAEYARPLTADRCPVLLCNKPDASKPAFFLAYLREGNQIERKKVD
ncbi:MAG: hypothetical protein JSR77_08675 [Planctomycetes bacterium]|nr:hypothetical protein [Planctomycetota bacterium]